MSGHGWSVPSESNGGVPVNIQDQTTQALDLDFIQAQGAPTTLNTDTAVDDTTIDLTNAAGFVDGNIVGIFSGGEGQFYFGTQIGAAVGNVITVDTPIDKVFESAISVVIRFTNDMTAVAGSLAAPQIFQIGPIGAAVEVDITRVMGYIQSATSMTDADFGDIAGGLTNGMAFRKSNGDNQNYWNAKTNGRLALICFDFVYTNNPPSGSSGARFRNTYAGSNKHGVTLRLEASETLEILIQDDLTSLEVFNMMAQGHVVTD